MTTLPDFYHLVLNCRKYRKPWNSGFFATVLVTYLFCWCYAPQSCVVWDHLLCIILRIFAFLHEINAKLPGRLMQMYSLYTRPSRLYRCSYITLIYCSEHVSKVMGMWAVYKNIRGHIATTLAIFHILTLEYACLSVSVRPWPKDTMTNTLSTC